MDKKTPEEIKKFIVRLKKNFDPEKIILFGSRAEGREWKRSDYDFIIVSSKFKGMHWLERISKIIKMWDLLADVDILPYTPKEFEDKKKNSSTVRHALKYGRLIGA